MDEQKIREEWVSRLWEWLNEQGYAFSLDEVRELHERNFTWNAEKAYVVVVNNNGLGPGVRHIVETKKPYDPEKFQHWYYEQYHKLDGDEFVYCPDHAHMFAFVKAVEMKGK